MMFDLKTFLFCLSFSFCHLVSAAPIHEAVEQGDIDELERLLDEEGVNPNIQGKWGMTPLHVAAISDLRGELVEEMMALLVMFGADPNIADQEGNYPLHLVIRNNNLGDSSFVLVALFISQGVNLNARDARKTRPLSYAMERANSHPTDANLYMVTLLVKSGAKIPNKKSYDIFSAKNPLYFYPSATIHNNSIHSKFTLRYRFDTKKSSPLDSLDLVNDVTFHSGVHFQTMLKYRIRF